MSTTEFDSDFETNRRTRLETARERASEKLDAARTRARERSGAAYDRARDRAARAQERTAAGIDTNPFGALVGGLAVGALIAALLPRSRREEELLGDYGRKIKDTAADAARAAKDAGRGKLDELGLNQEKAKQTLGDIASKAGEAARTSASAAAQTVKGKQANQPL